MRLADIDDAIEQVMKRKKLATPDENGDIRISVDAFIKFLENRPTVDIDTVRKCENCDIKELCNYYHYSNIKDWEKEIGTKCDEWKLIKEGK